MDAYLRIYCFDIVKVWQVSNAKYREYIQQLEEMASLVYVSSHYVPFAPEYSTYLISTNGKG